MRLGQKGKWTYVAEPTCSHADCKVLGLTAQVSIPRGSTTKHRCVHHIKTPTGVRAERQTATAELLARLGLTELA